MICIANSKTWQPIISHCDHFYLARDVDGVMVYVIKDGQEQVR